MGEMKIETKDAYYVGTHKYSFRQGEPAKIVGIKTVFRDKENFPSRVCFHVVYADGFEDWCPIEDSENYKIFTSEEIKLKFSTQ